MHFGDLLRRMTTRAGLSGNGLADAARISRSTLTRGYDSAENPFRPDTVHAIAAILAGRGGQDPEDITELERCTGVRWPAAPAERSRTPDDLSLSLASVYRSASPDVATAHAWVQELTERSSPGAVLDILKAMAAFAGYDLLPRFTSSDIESFRSAMNPSAASRTINVVSPPVQRDGYVEQRVVTYEAVEERKPAAGKASHGRTKRA